MGILAGWWRVAYRNKPCGTILEDASTPFKVIKNTFLCCAADPFVFRRGGKTYIFSEVISVARKGGMIGYSVFDGKKFSKWKIIIKEPYHMSFPNVFEKDGEVYIVPEAFQSNSIYAYKAVDFPEKWEKCHVIADDVKCVDTVFLKENDSEYLFTYDISEHDVKKLVRYTIENGTADKKSAKTITEDDGNARPAGNFFEKDGALYRAAQDCNGSYGKAVVFDRVDECTADSYSEERIARFAPDDIVINKKYKSQGLHTYNGNDEFEVIDLKNKIFHPVGIAYSAYRKVKKLFKA